MPPQSPASATCVHTPLTASPGLGPALGQLPQLDGLLRGHRPRLDPDPLRLKPLQGLELRLRQEHRGGHLPPARAKVHVAQVQVLQRQPVREGERHRHHVPQQHQGAHPVLGQGREVHFGQGEDLHLDGALHGQRHGGANERAGGRLVIRDDQA
ncbi:endo-glucanase [Stigmatella aurantiaca DW4/3-1]|uniref:Endo-glucanase n=1 Tax=Stigmatella aurantiaca (strain DW4/3-1) TaxID=378806 RepID=Q08NV3_STIAD|nr:endo-glucanase [Stigmatella aurantiaca DW4/3-1]